MRTIDAPKDREWTAMAAGAAADTHSHFWVVLEGVGGTEL